MVSIIKKSGLPLFLHGERLILGKGLRKVKPDIRTLTDMRPVLQDPSAKGQEKLYFMYRDLCMEKDKPLFAENEIRYDITIIAKGKIGNEHIKTYGHYHPEAEKGFTFPEIYEVLYGNACYLFQKDNDAIAVYASEGDKVIIPPNYGHVTINIGNKPLAMANLIETNFSSDYGLIRTNHGAVYYENDNKFVKNENYKKVPQLRILKPADIFGREPMYSTFLKSPKKFDFLKKPKEHAALFSKAFL